MNQESTSWVVWKVEIIFGGFYFEEYSSFEERVYVLDEEPFSISDGT